MKDYRKLEIYSIASETQVITLRQRSEMMQR